jgi:hypothetical protein
MGLFARRPVQNMDSDAPKPPVLLATTESVMQHPKPVPETVAPLPTVPARKSEAAKSLEVSPFPDQPTRTGAPIVSESVPVPKPKTQPQEQKPQVKEEARPYAPLFVKLTKYKEILSNVEFLMGTVDALKSQLELQNELSRLQMENSKSLQQSVEKIIGMLGKLDSDFLKPATIGGSDEGDAMGGEADSLQKTLTDLRAQIDSLKQDLDVPA